MKISKAKLKQIIKEEIESMMSQGADIQEQLQEIAYWMEEQGIYQPEAGVEAWLEINRVAPERAQALRDMSEEIYEYM